MATKQADIPIAIKAHMLGDVNELYLFDCIEFLIDYVGHLLDLLRILRIVLCDRPDQLRHQNVVNLLRLHPFDVQANNLFCSSF